MNSKACVLFLTNSEVHLCCLHNVGFPFGHCSVIGLQQVVEFIQLVLSAL